MSRPTALTHPRIADLREVDPAAGAEFGGKACGLARLTEAGARVPPAFVVGASTSGPDEWSAEARTEFCRRATELLADGPIVVRSSAIGEDSNERSFAGQFETVLGVGSVGDALSAAATCISSGSNERVAAYTGADRGIPVGLVVQAQVGAQVAGICFTADPLGHDRAIVLQAVAGRGDPLASGYADGEHWRIYRSGLGVWEARFDGPRVDAPVLTPERTIAVAAEAALLAATLGHPLDLEWAIDRDGALWWLQARPITAATFPGSFAVERFADGVDDGPITVWSNWNVRETLPNPLPPLSWTIWRDVIAPMVLRRLAALPESSPLRPHLVCLDLVHGRVYFNMNAMLGVPLLEALVRRFMTLFDDGAADTMRRLVSAGVLRPRRLPLTRLARMRLNALVYARFMMPLAKTLLPGRCLRGLETAGVALRSRGDLSTWSDARLLQEMQLVAAPECAPLWDGIQMETAATVVYHLALRAFRRSPWASGLLAAGIEGNPTTGIALGIDALITAARPFTPIFLASGSTGELFSRLEAAPGGSAWLVAFQDFLSRYGHRCPGEFDFSVPRWSEDPAMLLQLVRAGLHAPPAERLAARMQRLARERSLAVAEALAASPLWRRPLLRLMARLVELYMPLREAPKHQSLVVLDRARRAALELGRRFADRRVIAAIDDVFFLEWPELVSLVGHGSPRDTRTLVAERRARHADYRLRRPPDFLRSDGVPVEEEDADASADDVVLRGLGVSGGTAGGPVRILRGPDPTAMTDGDVIVMQFADPGWTPLFPRAAAIVIEVGGLMCHAAVVARELGIPAVSGVKEARRRLRDGTPVEVDGCRGTITVAPRPA